jgi:hypothetical protein
VRPVLPEVRVVTGAMTPEPPEVGGARPFVPAALVEEQERMLASRLQAGRSVARRGLRRRVVPPLVVGSTALLGAGVSAAWVSATLQGAAGAPENRSSGSRGSSGHAWAAYEKELARARAADAKALEHIRTALHSDSVVVKSLAEAAGRAIAASNKTTVINEAAPTSGAAGGTGYSGSGASSGGGSGAAGVDTAGAGGLGALPSLPPLPPMPAFSIPSTQGTTGATHHVP